MFRQIALFAAVPTMSIDSYFASLEEHVSQANIRKYKDPQVFEVFPQSFDTIQVIAEFPASFRGRDTILRVYSHRFTPPLFW